jgi:hypothetical protein
LFWKCHGGNHHNRRNRTSGNRLDGYHRISAAHHCKSRATHQQSDPDHNPGSGDDDIITTTTYHCPSSPHHDSTGDDHHGGAPARYDHSSSANYDHCGATGDNDHDCTSHHNHCCSRRDHPRCWRRSVLLQPDARHHFGRRHDYLDQPRHSPHRHVGVIADR